MQRSTTCPKCGGSMIEGVIIDHDRTRRSVSRWLKGRAAKSLWTGIKLQGEKLVETETYRCTRCGFLESYAPV